LAEAQHQLAEGRLDARHGTVILDEPDATIDGRLCPLCLLRHRRRTRADGLVRHPTVVGVAERLLGNDAWLLDYEQFGVVYQDARPDPGRPTRASAGTPTTSRVPTWTSGPGPPSPSTSTPRHRPTDSSACSRAATSAGSRASPSASSGSQGRSPCTKSGAMSSSTTPTCGNAAARATAYGGPAIRRHLRGSWHPAGTRLEPGHGTARLREERPPLIRRGANGPAVRVEATPVGRRPGRPFRPSTLLR